MEQSTILNLTHIIKIEVHPKKQFEKIKYNRVEKAIFQKAREGWYGLIDWYGPHWLSDEEFQNFLETHKQYYVDGEKIYEYPHLLFYLSDGTEFKSYKFTESGLEQDVKTITEKISSLIQIV